MAFSKPKLGVIGGSGIYQMEGAQLVAEHPLDTPFGPPSDPIIETEISGRIAYFLPRHGKGHRLLPSEINYRANIYALKSLGVTHILSVSAVGIMKEMIRPGDLVIPDQLFDATTKGLRSSTYFGEGLVGHVSLADPFCQELREIVKKACLGETSKVHHGGCYVCIEGPQFSTRAESEFYRKTIEPAVIGMTASPEAKLAREAEISYAVLALATDYDCWHESEDDVSAEAVIKVLRENASLANAVIQRVIAEIDQIKACVCHQAAKSALMTQRDKIPEGIKKKLELFYHAYWS